MIYFEFKQKFNLNGIWKDRYGVFYKRNGEWVGPYQYLFDKDTLTDEVLSNIKKKLKSQIKVAKLTFVEE